MTDNAITATGGYDNLQYCAQKFHLKVKRCIEIVKANLKDEGKTVIPAWLSSKNMKTFTTAGRSGIRADQSKICDKRFISSVIPCHVPDACATRNHHMPNGVQRSICEILRPLYCLPGKAATKTFMASDEEAVANRLAGLTVEEPMDESLSAQDIAFPIIRTN
ncbi:hypothetical protein BJ166DRAFT_501919 [Pestalotiopsis sp. NC0098]|nr:hypothetical protein BJ166DRAFT_501919 [Pestalotiopsis sp. NC0098]